MFAKPTHMPSQSDSGRFRNEQRLRGLVSWLVLSFLQVKASAVEALLKTTIPKALQSVANRALKESEHITTKFDDMVAAFDPKKELV